MASENKYTFEQALGVLKIASMIGVHHNLSDDEYFAHPAINCSGLKLIASKTPLHFKHQQTAPRIETKALTLGSAIHCATLEPEAFTERYVIAPPIDKRTKEGKAAWAELEASEKIVLSADDAELVASVAQSVRNHKTASKLLTSGNAEVAVFSQIDGMNVKCKCDYLRQNVAIIDLKTTEDASEKGFLKSVFNYGYHQQAAFYMDVLESIGQPVDAFVFIAVEKTAPFAVGIYELDAECVAIGRALNQRAMATHRECLETDDWRGYSENIELLSAPAWVVRQAENSVSV
jgi:exodeoxyribonuclease VIII